MKLAQVAAALLATTVVTACSNTGGTAVSADPISGASQDTLTDQVDGAAPDAGDIDDSTGTPMG